MGSVGGGDADLATTVGSAVVLKKVEGKGVSERERTNDDDDERKQNVPWQNQ